jgi:pyridoxal 5'-phosphate synthase glutaminase subunit Pdx2
VSSWCGFSAIGPHQVRSLRRGGAGMLLNSGFAAALVVGERLGFVVIMSAPTVGVLALQGDVREHLEALEAAGAEPQRVRRPEELALVDALVLPGGESTTIAKLARTFDVLDPLRARVKDGMPTYGSCAGMILLADRVLDAPADQETIGGIDMTVRRNAFGRQVDSFEGDVHIRDLAAAPSTACSSAHPGSWTAATRSRSSAGSRAARPPVGSSRSGRDICSRLPSTPS